MNLNSIGYEITYLTRSDWTGLFSTTQKLVADQTVVNQENYWEAADIPVSSNAKMPKMGGDSDVADVQLLGKFYDTPYGRTNWTGSVE